MNQARDVPHRDPVLVRHPNPFVPFQSRYLVSEPSQGQVSSVAVPVGVQFSGRVGRPVHRRPRTSQTGEMTGQRCQDPLPPPERPPGAVGNRVSLSAVQLAKAPARCQ
jgi:hypothetical protein